MPFPLGYVLGGAVAGIAAKVILDKRKAAQGVQPALAASTLAPGSAYAVQFMVDPSQVKGVDANAFSQFAKASFGDLGWTVMSAPMTQTMQDMTNYFNGQKSAWTFVGKWNGPGFNMTTLPAFVPPGQIQFFPAPVQV